MDKLRSVFARALSLPLSAITTDTSPQNTPEWDSLRAIGILADIESEFRIRLSFAESLQITSVGKAWDTICKKKDS